MREFFEALKVFLEALGTEVQLSEYNTMKVRIAGCEFFAQRTRTFGKVKFLGRTFKPPYNVGQAAGLVVQALPEQLKLKKQREERLAKVSRAASVNAALRGTEIGGRFHMEWDNCFRVTFSHPDEGTVMAAMDLLQDQFCEDVSAPRTTEQDLLLKEVRKLCGKLDDEHRDALIREIDV